MDIRELDARLQEYARSTGRFPETADGLRPLLATGALTAEPHDAWGRPYHYALVEGRPVITSYGSDGRPAGEGPDADISNLSPDRTDVRTQVRIR